MISFPPPGLELETGQWSRNQETLIMWLVWTGCWRTAEKLVISIIPASWVWLVTLLALWGFLRQGGWIAWRSPLVSRPPLGGRLKCFRVRVRLFGPESAYEVLGSTEGRKQMTVTDLPTFCSRETPAFFLSSLVLTDPLWLGFISSQIPCCSCYWSVWVPCAIKRLLLETLSMSWLKWLSLGPYLELSLCSS